VPKIFNLNIDIKDVINQRVNKSRMFDDVYCDDML